MRTFRTYTCVVLFLLPLKLNAQNWGYGSYVGTGSSRGVSVGFQPDVVIIKAATAQYAYISTSTMSANQSMALASNSAFAANIITSLSSPSNGFTVGTAAASNNTGTTYYYAAFKQAAGSIKVGTYTGNGSGTQAITGLGFAPDLIIVLASGTYPQFRLNVSGMTGYDFVNGSNCGSGLSIRSFDADGFTVTGASTVPNLNVSGTVYHYVAIKANSSLLLGSYSGNGFSVTTLNLGSQPQMFICTDGFSSAPVFKTSSMGSTTSCYFTNTATVTTQFTAWNSPVNTIKFPAGATNTNSNASSYYYAVFTNGALPVELLSFSAGMEGNSVRLSWETASEKNNDRFEIEKSLEGGVFQVIGTRKGKGNSTIPASYTFTDPDPGSGIQYYRLRQIDFDGKVTYSQVTEAQVMSAVRISSTQVDPGEEIYISTDAGKSPGEMQVKLYTISGQQVYSASTHSSDLLIPTEGLSPGLYVLHFFDGNNNLVKKIVVK